MGKFTEELKQLITAENAEIDGCNVKIEQGSGGWTIDVKDPAGKRMGGAFIKGEADKNQLSNIAKAIITACKIQNKTAAKIKTAGNYTIQLSPQEVEQLKYFSSRGYDCGLVAALNLVDEAKGIYSISENEMHKISEKSQEHGAWTNLNWASHLGQKIQKLFQSVV